MAETTSIEWTDSSWNPLRGVAGKWHCSKVSPGCHNCYAERINVRFGGPAYKRGADTFRLDSKALAEPLRWKTGRRVFVCSMTDLFHEDVPEEFIDRVFGVMHAANWHTYQVLTKRPDRMLAYLSAPGVSRRVMQAGRNAAKGRGLDVLNDAGVICWPMRQVWCGVSVEDQQRADEHIPLLLQTPAAVRFLSCEPLLGPVDLSAFFGGEYATIMGSEPNYNFGVNWVIIGGESGPGARPMDVAWARSLVAQCKAAAVPVFVKQLGSQPYIDHSPEPAATIARKHSVGPLVAEFIALSDRKGGDPAEWPENLRVREFPEVANG